MATSAVNYAAAATITMTLASLASDTSLVAGRQCTPVDNTSNLYVDALVGGKVTTGTSPTASKQIEIWLFASYDGTSYSGGAGAADANFTPVGSVKGNWRLLTMIPTTATSNQTMTWGPFSVAQAYGGVLPPKWGVWMVHNTGVALNATAGNHEVKYTGIKYTST